MDDLYEMILSNNDADLKPIISLVWKLIKLNYIESVVSIDDVSSFANDFFYGINDKEQLNRFRNNLIKIKNNVLTLDSVKSNKQSVITELKSLIEKLNEKRNLRLNEIISDGVIDKENLQFAIDFFYDEDHIMEELLALRSERDDLSLIQETDELLNNIKDMRSLILHKLDEIDALFIDDKKPKKIHVINYFRWLRKRNENYFKQEEILSEICSIIENGSHKKENINLKYYCYEELTRLGFNYEQMKRLNMKGKTKKMFCDLRDELIVEYDIIIRYIEDFINSIHVSSVHIDNQQHLKRLSAFLDNRCNNYVSYIINNIKRSEKSKHNTLFFKVILILRFIENSQCTIDNLYNHSLDESIKLSGSVISEFSELGFGK